MLFGLAFGRFHSFALVKPCSVGKPVGEHNFPLEILRHYSHVSRNQPLLLVDVLVSSKITETCVMGFSTSCLSLTYPITRTLSKLPSCVNDLFGWL